MANKVIRKEKNTKEKIRAVARAEFLKHGFKDVSLEKIVKDAGYTKGAFYGYYPDKASLFNDIVSEAGEGLVSEFITAQNRHMDLIPGGDANKAVDMSREYLKYVIKYIYDHFDEFRLIICKSEGTAYENYIDKLVELNVKETLKFHRAMKRRGMTTGNVSSDLQRIITKAYFSAIFETVRANMSRKKAMSYTGELASFFEGGWRAIMQY